MAPQLPTGLPSRLTAGLPVALGRGEPGLRIELAPVCFTLGRKSNQTKKYQALARGCGRLGNRSRSRGGLG